MSMFGVPSAIKIDNSYREEAKSESTNKPKQEKDFYGCLENGDVTQFYFKKLQEQELALSLIVIINLYLIIFSANLSFPQIKDEELPTLNLCLYFITISTIIAMTLIALRTMTVLKLEKEQKLVYQKVSLISSKKILYLLLEWIFLLLQPYPFLIYQTFSSSNQQVGYNIQYPANDLLTILSFTRMYILLRAALILTPYMNNRSNRLCKMYGCRADYSYSLKCIFKDHPLKLICIFYIFSATVFAYLVYIAERKLVFSEEGIDKLSACTDYPNALWLILMTTTTVGYGDYYPQTPLGRIIILFVAIWGTLTVSIMVVVVSNTLSMQKTELRTSKILNKLDLREKLQCKAGRVVGYFFLAFSKKSKHKKLSVLKFLKAKGEFAQTRKTIKQMAEVNDLQDEIAAHFLKLNSDIQILNSNQDRIIAFIHKNFNTERQQPIVQQREQEQDMSQEEEPRPPNFLKLFKNQLKQKLA